VIAITVIGVLLALTGIVQQAVFNGKIYGFWVPKTVGSSFGPFVNKNHFAGWMLLALPLTVGLASGRIARGMRGVKPQWRERLLWLSSPEANQLILLIAASTLMGLALVLTTSRSAIGAMALALALTGWFVKQARVTARRQAATHLYLALLACAVVGWVGAGTIGHHFVEAEWGEFHRRLGPWSDAWRIATAFPLVGTGLNTYGVATLFYQRHDLAFHYAEAHNDYLQLAAEGGLLLTIPAALCVLLLIGGIRKRMREDIGTSTYWIRAGAITSLVAIALQEGVEFSLQMPGNAALFAVVCGIALHKTPHRRLKEKETDGVVPRYPLRVQEHD
jgi:O-antigen ligase